MLIFKLALKVKSTGMCDKTILFKPWRTLLYPGSWFSIIEAKKKHNLILYQSPENSEEKTDPSSILSPVKVRGAT